MSDKKAKDDWYEKITTVSGNLKVEMEANHKLIQHGKNRYYDKLKDVDPELRKIINKQGTFLVTSSIRVEVFVSYYDIHTLLNI